MNKYIYLPLLLLLSLFLTACDQKSDSDKTQVTKQEINIGMTPSMHNILMEKIVKPKLEAIGYKVNLVNFSSLRDSDTALAEGSIDLNAAQHQAYLDTYMRETGNDDLVSLVHIPSISAALFSMKYSSVNDIKKGQTIAIPNDPSNAARALIMLQKLNWITLKNDINLGAASIHDIAENKYNLQFRVVLSELIPRMLDEVDFAIMPGGIAWMSKVDAKHAIYYEQLSPNLEILVAIKKQNLTAPWAEDIKKLYQSDEMKQFITEDPDAKGRFIWPQG
ncbi:MetQ/NlpA family ABC transporter substrate-binding protein [Orbus wheelerorum]|uniref:MetQ/NlpA family ABC transporter substrate-binding protein n=1 Tax=Orbus wheelerorum TaxID=3074111 RepID=UPI00370DC240